MDLLLMAFASLGLFTGPVSTVEVSANAHLEPALGQQVITAELDDNFENCYTLDLTVSIGGSSTTVTAQGCGDTPRAGLFALGEAVREIANQR